MRFVIVTGMSGAGKSTTLKMMEDMGYFCVDNMPIPLMTKLTELLIVPNGEITKIALGLDIRSGQNLRALDQVLDELEKTKIPLEILFLYSRQKYGSVHCAAPWSASGLYPGYNLPFLLKRQFSYVLWQSRSQFCRPLRVGGSFLSLYIFSPVYHHSIQEKESTCTGPGSGRT